MTVETPKRFPPSGSREVWRRWHPQCILAYEMNGEPLPIKHGAPLRLRLETQVGFKMAKWIERLRPGRGDLSPMTRSDTKQLDENQKREVLEKAGQRSFTCGSCGSSAFEVGDALYLGFLFLSEDRDNYMVALTCKKSDCEAPRTGIKLHGAEFLH